MMDKNKAGSGVQGNEDPIRSNRNYLQLKSYEQMGFCMFLPSHTYEKIQSHNPKLRGYLPGNGYHIPSLGRGKSSSTVPWDGIC